MGRHAMIGGSRRSFRMCYRFLLLTEIRRACVV
jgi:hypothetical protein